jgi:NitT/TauT family transport system ATP-binding protein
MASDETPEPTESATTSATSAGEIVIENLSKTYNEGRPQAVEALRDVDLTVEDGEFVTIVGPSGCGKSTLMEIVAGLVPKSSGSVRIGDEEVTKPRQEIGVVFQEYSLFPWRTVLRNAAFGLEVMGVDKDERLDRAREMLELVGLEGFEDAHPEELSGGMQQRVAIARTLATDPDILLMDEPFGALDEQTRMYMGEELLRIWGETEKTVIFITHSLQESVLLSDRVVVLSTRPGQIREIVDVDLDRPRDTDIIGSEAFNRAQSQIWQLIKDEGGAAETDVEALDGH